MKKVLLVGAGSKWGKNFTSLLLSTGFQVDLISGTEVVSPTGENFNLIPVDWQNFRDPNEIFAIIDKLKFAPYDLVFFNQNAPGAPDEWEFQNEIHVDRWSHSFWVNCQLPSMMVDKLCQKKLIQEETRIGWMLTGLIKGQGKELWRHAGYASCKYTNMAMMQGFSRYKPGIYFALQPGSLTPDTYNDDSLRILKLINNLKASDSGHCFEKNGSSWNIHS